MPLSQQEFETILADDTKKISETIVWRNAQGHSPAKEFRVEVDSAAEYPLFVKGWFNSFSEKLSYAIIYQGVGRIYGLDLGAEHINPDGSPVGDKHKNSWREGSRDKWAYVPVDITETWNHPVEVWRQFCVEARLTHSGIMTQPARQGGLLL